MAEVGVAASIVGIVGFALQLSKKLYEFSTTTSTAGEEICFVAKNVTNYADALEILADRLNDDDPVHSKRALKVVHRLYGQSCDLFDLINEMIPEPKYGRDDITFLQKVAWNFKKSEVQYLAGHIESLKSTVTLLVAVLFAGKRIRARRKSSKSRKSTNSDVADAEKERTRVSIAFIEQVEAYNKLPELKQQAAVDTRLPLEPGGEVEYGNGPSERRDELEVEQLVADIPMLNLQLELKRNSEDQTQLMLHHPDDIFSYLLGQYTNLAEQSQVDTQLHSETMQRVLRTDTEHSAAQKTKIFPEVRESPDLKMNDPGNREEKPFVKSYRKPSKTERDRSSYHWAATTKEPDLLTYSSLRTKQQQQNRSESNDSEQVRVYKNPTQRERKQVRFVGVEDKREYHDEKGHEYSKENDQSLEDHNYEEGSNLVEEIDHFPIYGVQDIQEVVDKLNSEWIHIRKNSTEDSAATRRQKFQRFKEQVLKAINEAPELRPSSSDKQDIIQNKRAALKQLERILTGVGFALFLNISIPGYSKSSSFLHKD